MKLKSIAKNQTEVTFPDGTMVLYSYETPVAAYHALTDAEDTRGEVGNWLRTNYKWSSTTTRHINKWLASHLFLDDPASVVPIAVYQQVIENLVAERTLLVHSVGFSTRAMYRTEFE